MGRLTKAWVLYFLWVLVMDNFRLTSFLFVITGLCFLIFPGQADVRASITLSSLIIRDTLE